MTVNNVKVVQALLIKQKDLRFYVFGIDAGTLLEIAYFNTREIDRETGVERPHSQRRSTEIKKFLEESDEATLPNNIIINFRTTELLNIDSLSYENGSLSIPILPELGFVIDGQHRLRAFKDSSLLDFQLVVSAFENLSLAKAAEMFVNINYYQKPVSKSLVFDLLGISKDVFPKFYPHHSITKKFNDTLKSPWFGNIKMLGIGKGSISQSTFIMAMEENKVLDLLGEIGEEEQFNILWGYFNAIKSLFEKYWCTQKSNLCKSVGFYAQMMLFPKVLQRISEGGIKAISKLDRTTITNKILDELSSLKEKINFEGETSNFVGKKGARDLYKKILNLLGWDE
jgi:DGQHR domain-containing protein